MTTKEQFLTYLKDNPEHKQLISTHLNLIITVDTNFKHIVELDVLVSALKSGLSDYYKEYHPAQHNIVKFMHVIADETRAAHYSKTFKNEHHPKFGQPLYTAQEAIKELT